MIYNVMLVSGVQHDSIFVYCEMITVSLVNIHHHIATPFSLVVIILLVSVIPVPRTEYVFSKHLPNEQMEKEMGYTCK